MKTDVLPELNDIMKPDVMPGLTWHLSQKELLEKDTGSSPV